MKRKNILTKNISNKKLYESIMKDVAKTIKKHLNENVEDDLLDDLLIYINDNRNFSNDEIKVALGNMEEDRVPLYVADSDINDNLYDLVSDFADDNELSEEWVDEITEDLEDLFYKFVDKFENEIW